MEYTKERLCGVAEPFLVFVCIFVSDASDRALQRSLYLIFGDDCNCFGFEKGGQLFAYRHSYCDIFEIVCVIGVCYAFLFVGATINKYIVHNALISGKYG